MIHGVARIPYYLQPMGQVELGDWTSCWKTIPTPLFILEKLGTWPLQKVGVLSQELIAIFFLEFRVLGGDD